MKYQSPIIVRYVSLFNVNKSYRLYILFISKWRESILESVEPCDVHINWYYKFVITCVIIINCNVSSSFYYTTFYDANLPIFTDTSLESDKFHKI